MVDAILLGSPRRGLSKVYCIGPYPRSIPQSDMACTTSNTEYPWPELRLNRRCFSTGVEVVSEVIEWIPREMALATSTTWMYSRRQVPSGVSYWFPKMENGRLAKWVWITLGIKWVSGLCSSPSILDLLMGCCIAPATLNSLKTILDRPLCCISCSAASLPSP